MIGDFSGLSGARGFLDAIAAASAEARAFERAASVPSGGPARVGRGEPDEEQCGGGAGAKDPDRDALVVAGHGGSNMHIEIGRAGARRSAKCVVIHFNLLNESWPGCPTFSARN